MAEPSLILWQGTLAQPQRSVLGLLGHLEQLALTPAQAQTFLVESGLPPIAMAEPDIPITFETQVRCLGRIVARLDPARSIVGHATELGIGVNITSFGMLGLAALHAPDVPTAMRLFWTCPELSWGTSSYRVAVHGDHVVHSFEMDPSARDLALSDALVDYCVTVDLAATVRLVEEILGPGRRPLAASLPFAAPHDADHIVEALGCDVRFDAERASLTYDLALVNETPVLANPLIFRVYEKLTEQLANQLRTDVPLRDQVRRILAMSAPPPDRESVASMLAMSPRSLARKLAAEGTSYAELQRERRLAQAEVYLKNPSVPMHEIATKLGFSDAAAFSRAFRVWSGASPSDHRRMLIER